LSIVGPGGQHTTLCTGFGTIEDVALDAQGRLYVSEDSNGLIVQITPARTPPNAVEIDGPATARLHQGASLIATVHPLTTTRPITLTWQATGSPAWGGDAAGSGSMTVGPALSATAVLTWAIPGPQWITVTATNAEGAVTATHALTVYTPPPIADFVGAPTRGLAPLVVSFANRSSGDDLAIFWEFGDGHSSTAYSPTHTYHAAGAYTVTLTVSGPGGSDTETKPAYITALRGLYLPLVVRLW
jgi:PKD repeat protein